MLLIAENQPSPLPSSELVRFDVWRWRMMAKNEVDRSRFTYRKSPERTHHPRTVEYSIYIYIGDTYSISNYGNLGRAFWPHLDISPSHHTSSHHTHNSLSLNGTSWDKHLDKQSSGEQVLLPARKASHVLGYISSLESNLPKGVLTVWKLKICLWIWKKKKKKCLYFRF